MLGPSRRHAVCSACARHRCFSAPGGVKLAARAYDGWIASANYRTPEEVVGALGVYRAAGGSRAIVPTIQVSSATDLGKLQAMLRQFAKAGFDDAVLMVHAGAASPEALRKLVD